MEFEVGDVKSFIDTLWVIDCAILVFIMQAGFMCVESGLSRHKNSINVALKNAADFGVSVVVFWLFGFGLMFGKSFNGLFGTDLFMFATDISQYQTYFVFQAMFVATAATIISGAVAERLKFVGYLVMTIFATGIIYPIVGHWAWSSSYLGEAMNKGWLAALGFVDFAGSTIVHSVGGWIALSGVLILGPRIGKYSEANKGKFTGSSFPLAVLGTLILWFGWFGFNGGSNGAMDDAVPLILINTFLAAAFGLLTSLVVSFTIFKKPDPFYVILGPLAGLVSITAACNSVNSLIAILIGFHFLTASFFPTILAILIARSIATQHKTFEKVKCKSSDRNSQIPLSGFIQLFFTTQTIPFTIDQISSVLLKSLFTSLISACIASIKIP